jgi:uncharacterized protein DUF998
MTSRARPRRTTTRALLGCGIAAGPLFLGVATAEGAARPGYDPARHPVSSLALGPRGWRQIANFGVTGALYLAGAVGLVRAGAPRAAAALTATVGAGLLGAGVFATDPIGGYPPGTPPVPEPSTVTGGLHYLASSPVSLCVPAMAVMEAVSAGRAGDRRWAAVSATAAVAGLGTFGLAGAGFSQATPFTARGGLFQRLSLAIGLGWLSALFARAS